MDNTYIKNNAMFILLAAKRWAKTRTYDDKYPVYMAITLEQRMLPVDQPWPIFQETSKYKAFLRAKLEYPTFTNLVSIDLSPKLHPRFAVKEVR